MTWLSDIFGRIVGGDSWSVKVGITTVLGVYLLFRSKYIRHSGTDMLLLTLPQLLKRKRSPNFLKIAIMCDRRPLAKEFVKDLLANRSLIADQFNATGLINCAPQKLLKDSIDHFISKADYYDPEMIIFFEEAVRMHLLTEATIQDIYWTGKGSQNYQPWRKETQKPWRKFSKQFLEKDADARKIDPTIPLIFLFCDDTCVDAKLTLKQPDGWFQFLESKKMKEQTLLDQYDIALYFTNSNDRNHNYEDNEEERLSQVAALIYDTWSNFKSFHHVVVDNKQFEPAFEKVKTILTDQIKLREFYKANILSQSLDLKFPSRIIFSDRTMGLLEDLGPISDFEETMKRQPLLKKIGLRQIFNVLAKYAKWEKDPKSVECIKWGEEVEGNFLRRSPKPPHHLKLCKEPLGDEVNNIGFPLMLEYGSWMFQMIPVGPYTAQECKFSDIIFSMRDRYSRVNQIKDKVALTIPVMPMLGVETQWQHQEAAQLSKKHTESECNGKSQNQTQLNKEQHTPSSKTISSKPWKNLQQYHRPPVPPLNNPISFSQYLDDSHTADHSRFRTLTKNIRQRRGQNVDIRVPVFQDKNTSIEQLRETQPYDGFIHMDAMGFGMGLCCLQCTFSTKSLEHARYVYDQLHILSPLFLAVTAGSPFHKGKLADWDSRWNIISASVDDRNANERDPNHPAYIPTSRYSDSGMYLWDGKSNLPHYNDIDLRVSAEDLSQVYDTAKQMGVPIDPLLARHIANIFKRDFLICHERFTELGDDSNILFEMLNGTNWNSARLKIPIDDQIGWRVQFRSMEVQLTPDENSAYSLLIYIMTRIFHHSERLNLYIPISMVRQNFTRAHARKAVTQQRFYFRTNFRDQGEPIIQELTLVEIWFGKGNLFPGLFAEVECCLADCMKCCPNILRRTRQFLREVCTGKRLTLAEWMRRFIDKHPAYHHNSILNSKIVEDLLTRLHQISTGKGEPEANFAPVFNFDQFTDKKKECKSDKAK